MFVKDRTSRITYLLHGLIALLVRTILASEMHPPVFHKIGNSACCTGVQDSEWRVEKRVPGPSLRVGQRRCPVQKIVAALPPSGAQRPEPAEEHTIFAQSEMGFTDWWEARDS
jgi:hypothetical protein